MRTALTITHQFKPGGCIPRQPSNTHRPFCSSCLHAVVQFRVAGGDIGGGGGAEAEAEARTVSIVMDAEHKAPDGVLVDTCIGCVERLEIELAAPPDRSRLMLDTTRSMCVLSDRGAVCVRRPANHGAGSSATPLCRGCACGSGGARNTKLMTLQPGWLSCWACVAGLVPRYEAEALVQAYAELRSAQQVRTLHVRGACTHARSHSKQLALHLFLAGLGRRRRGCAPSRPRVRRGTASCARPRTRART